MWAVRALARATRFILKVAGNAGNSRTDALRSHPTNRYFVFLWIIWKFRYNGLAIRMISDLMCCQFKRMLILSHIASSEDWNLAPMNVLSFVRWCEIQPMQSDLFPHRIRLAFEF